VKAKCYTLPEAKSLVNYVPAIQAIALWIGMEKWYIPAIFSLIPYLILKCKKNLTDLSGSV